MKAYRYRDLSLIELDSGEIIVSACDSCGGIGEKPMDILKVSARITGSFALRVALMEVLCCGAEVISVYDSLCCEMNPTGKAVIIGIKEELAKAEVDIQLLSGSTEENFETAMTGIGIVVLGLCREKPLFCGICPGDLAVMVGRPKSGSEINTAGDADMATYAEIRFLLSCDGVKEIVPCGSKGIEYEAEQIAAGSGLLFDAKTEHADFLHRSAGPASCLLVAAEPLAVAKIQEQFGEKKVTVLGRFICKEAHS